MELVTDAIDYSYNSMWFVNIHKTLHYLCMCKVNHLHTLLTFTIYKHC